MDRTGGFSRRRFSRLGGLAAMGLASGLAAGCSARPEPPSAVPHEAPAPPAALASSQPKPREAWLRLAVGNDRFAGGKAKHPRQGAERRRALAAGQHPFACVLGCVDSRVTPELIFDQGLGDLFTVRSAGEVLDDAVVGSIEYGVEHLEVPLVVVLGHVDCGAVRAAIDLVQGTGRLRGDVSSLVRSIEGAVRATKPDSDPERFLTACVAEQARRVVAELRERSHAVDTAVREHRLELRSVVYDIRTGRVSATSAQNLRQPSTG